MSFFESLERLRQRPEKERKKILLLTVAALTLIIIVVWAQNIDLAPSEKRADNSPAPWEILLGAFLEGAQNIKDTVKTDIYERDK